MSGLLDVLFPPACAACSRVLDEDVAFCAECSNALVALPLPRCATCAEPGSFPHDRCARCQARPPPFRATTAPFVHDGPMARAIHRFKYEDHPELARPLAALLAREAAQALQSAPSTVCAIPLHAARFRERRYDHAQLLAEEIARRTGRVSARTLLVRERATERQVGLTEERREKNVSGAFRATQEVSGGVLLVDDVLTTGATARAAAQALIDAGASEIRVLTLARAYSAA